MKKENVFGIMMAVAFLLFPAMSMAMEGPGMGMDKDRAEGVSEAEDKSLGLTEQQRSQMKALREEHRAQMEGVRADLKAKRQAFIAEVEGPNPERSRAEALLKEVLSLEEKIARHRMDIVFKMRTILTPEQYQKLHELREKRKAQMKERHGQKGGAGLKGMKKERK